jgi:hypothetical protein
MGGIDVGGAVYEQAKRGLDYINLMGYIKGESDRRKSETAWDAYVFGDFTQENTAMRIASGKDELEFVEKGALGEESRYGKTVSKEGGGRTITIVDTGHADNVAVLGHEAYRDGKVNSNNEDEMWNAVMGHTKIAARMREAGYSFNDEGVIWLDLAMYDYALSMGDMDIMRKYADAFYENGEDYFDFDFGRFGFDPVSEFTNVITQEDAGLRFAGLLQAASKGDPSAKAMLSEIVRTAAEQGVEFADKASNVASIASIVALLIPQASVPIAVAATGTNGSGFILSLLADNEGKRNKFFTSVALDVAFKGASKLIKNYPVWNNELNGYYGAITGKNIPTWEGKTVDLLQLLTGIIVPPLFEGKK